MALRMRSLLAALLLAHLAGAQQTVQRMKAEYEDRLQKAHVANCVVDIGIATTFLGKAGILINAANDNCDSEDDTGRGCLAAVSGVVASFSWGATFIAASAAECRSTLKLVDEHAVLVEACTADVAVTVATLSILVNSGAVIKDTCPGPRGNEKETPEDGEADDDRRLLAAPAADPAAEGRRLAAIAASRSLALDKIMKAAHKLKAHGFAAPPSPSPKKLVKNALKGVKQVPKEEPTEGRTAAQNAACAFNVMQFTFLSARAGLMINYAVDDCSAYAQEIGGEITKAKCITDIGRAVGAFGYTASGIAFTIAQCPDVLTRLDPACGGAIANLVAGVAELVGNSADFSNSCAALGKGQAEQDEITSIVADPVRRLSSWANASSPGPTFV